MNISDSFPNVDIAFGNILLGIAFSSDLKDS